MIILFIVAKIYLNLESLKNAEKIQSMIRECLIYFPKHVPPLFHQGFYFEIRHAIC